MIGDRIHQPTGFLILSEYCGHPIMERSYETVWWRCNDRTGARLTGAVGKKSGKSKQAPIYPGDIPWLPPLTLHSPFIKTGRGYQAPVFEEQGTER